MDGGCTCIADAASNPVSSETYLAPGLVRARLVWCPWEFITEFGDDFCRHHDVLKSYVAVLFQGWASNLLVELESGGVIGFVKITAQK